MTDKMESKIIMKPFLAYLLAALIFAGPAVDISRAEEIDLSVNPPLIKINKKDGGDATAQIVLKNKSAGTLDIKVLLRPFRALNEDGSTEIIPENQIPISYKNLFNDLKIMDNGSEVSNFQIAPEQEKVLELDIGSGSDTINSDYYFTIIFMATSGAIPSENKADASEYERDETVSGHTLIEAGIGTNVILSPDRELIPQAEIAEFSVPATAESGPVGFKVRLNNTGEQVLRPTGVILIKNMFGQTVGRVDLEPVNVISGSIRIIPDKGYTDRIEASGQTDLSAVWPEKFLLGVYSADLSIALSEKGPVLNKSIYFVGLPVVTAIILSVFIGLLIFVILRINHYLRRQK